MYSPQEIVDMIFRCHPSTKLSDHAKDLQLFNLLMAFDGKRSVQTIARDDAYDLDFLTSKINQLVEMRLIEAVGGSGARIPKKLIDEIAAELSSFVGPMSTVLIKECAAKMGHDVQNIPPAKGPTLIDSLAGFIQPQSNANAFRQRMAAKIDAL